MSKLAQEDVPTMIYYPQPLHLQPCYADLGYRTVSTNPCGEIPLCPYDSCRLLAINLYSYVDQPFTKEASFNFDLFRKHVAMAQRIIDDIIDLELEKIDAARRQER